MAVDTCERGRSGRNCGHAQRHREGNRALLAPRIHTHLDGRCGPRGPVITISPRGYEFVSTRFFRRASWLVWRIDDLRNLKSYYRTV